MRPFGILVAKTIQCVRFFNFNVCAGLSFSEILHRRHTTEGESHDPNCSPGEAYPLQLFTRPRYLCKGPERRGVSETNLYVVLLPKTDGEPGQVHVPPNH